MAWWSWLVVGLVAVAVSWVLVGVPGQRRELDCEATVLELAAGDGCARLLRQDLTRDALLLERLGPAMHDVIPEPATRHDLLCEAAARLWRPLGDDIDLPTGADVARRLRDVIPRLWEELGRPCSQETIDDAIACVLSDLAGASQLAERVLDDFCDHFAPLAGDALGPGGGVAVLRRER